MAGPAIEAGPLRPGRLPSAWRIPAVQLTLQAIDWGRRGGAAPSVTHPHAFAAESECPMRKATPGDCARQNRLWTGAVVPQGRAHAPSAERPMLAAQQSTPPP